MKYDYVSIIYLYLDLILVMLGLGPYLSDFFVLCNLRKGQLYFVYLFTQSPRALGNQTNRNEKELLCIGHISA